MGDITTSRESMERIFELLIKWIEEKDLRMFWNLSLERKDHNDIEMYVFRNKGDVYIHTTPRLIVGYINAWWDGLKAGIKVMEGRGWL